MRVALTVVAVSSLALGVTLGATAGCSSSDGSVATRDASDEAADGGADAPVGDSASACPNVLPATCPSPEPSYEDDVLPILEQRCYTCHADAGPTTSGSGIDFGSYANVYQLRGDILSQVNDCRMPPATAPQPTIAQRTTLLGWLKCEAPDN
jgi:hypothetical protein